MEFSNILFEARSKHICGLPIKKEAQHYIDELLQLLFPQFSDTVYYNAEEVNSELNLLKKDLKHLLSSLSFEEKLDEQIIAEKFFEKIPEVYKKLLLDSEAIYKGDPAAYSINEVILAYPGFLAITIYRFAHELYLLKVPVLPRILSEYAHQITGVDIHPGAQIGVSFCIDHGTGIVIGETTIIGDNVKLYQGVTLGALSVSKRLANTKRHPTIEDGVVIYSQAVILGGKTVIGEKCTIGGNVWITESVPPNSIVYNRSKIGFKNDKITAELLDFNI
ncbi:MAG: serine O-acetyltransferase EpsC [bacterium]